MAQYAAASLGLVLVNLNPAYRAFELEHAIKLVGMKGIICTPQLKSSNYIALLNEMIPELSTHRSGAELHCQAFPSLRHVFVVGEERFAGTIRLQDALVHRDTSSNLVSDAALDRLRLGVKPDDAHNIQFTSGTTGLPKGATLSHRNIVNNGYYIGKRQRLSESDSIAVPVPLFHCFGMVIGNIAAFTHGARLVYPSAVFDAKAVLEAVQAEKCTSLYGVPTMFLAELDHADFKRYDVSSLRTGVMAGTTCPPHLMKRVVEELNMKEITICYGMTETSPVSVQTEPDDSFEKRTETVGSIHDHVECKVVDTDGNVVPVGTAGELLTKGYCVMLGYWNDEKRTKESVKDGWMHTGDLAKVGEDGYFQIVGRIKDMIIRGGENIFPREVEDFLIKHPAISDIQVIGVPGSRLCFCFFALIILALCSDKKYGEELCAWVILRPGHTATVDEVQQFCKGRIAHYKIPRYILFVESFPMTLSGKVKKFEMRAETAKRLGLSEEAK